MFFKKEKSKQQEKGDFYRKRCIIARFVATNFS